MQACWKVSECCLSIQIEIKDVRRNIYIHIYIDQRPKNKVIKWCDKSYLDVVMMGRRGLA